MKRMNVIICGLGAVGLTYANKFKEVSNLISAVSNGEIRFKVEFSNSAAHIDKLEKLLHELILAFIDGILILCLCFSEVGLQKYILFIFVVFISVCLFIKMIIDKIHNGY